MIRCILHWNIRLCFQLPWERPEACESLPRSNCLAVGNSDMVDGIRRPRQWQTLLPQRRHGFSLVPASSHRRRTCFDYYLRGIHLHLFPDDQAAAVVAQSCQRNAQKPNRREEQEGKEGLMTNIALPWSIPNEKKRFRKIEENVVIFRISTLTLRLRANF